MAAEDHGAPTDVYGTLWDRALVMWLAYDISSAKQNRSNYYQDVTMMQLADHSSTPGNLHWDFLACELDPES